MDPATTMARRPTDPIIRPASRAEASLLSQLAFESKAYWGYDADFMVACREELTVTEEELDREPSYVAEVTVWPCLDQYALIIR